VKGVRKNSFHGGFSAPLTTRPSIFVKRTAVRHKTRIFIIRKKRKHRMLKTIVQAALLVACLSAFTQAGNVKYSPRGATSAWRGGEYNRVLKTDKKQKEDGDNKKTSSPVPPGTVPPVMVPGGTVPPDMVPGGTVPPVMVPGGTVPPVMGPDVEMDDGPEMNDGPVSDMPSSVPNVDEGLEMDDGPEMVDGPVSDMPSSVPNGDQASDAPSAMPTAIEIEEDVAAVNAAQSASGASVVSALAAVSFASWMTVVAL
jgi:hypothetical protein